MFLAITFFSTFIFPSLSPSLLNMGIMPCHQPNYGSDYASRSYSNRLESNPPSFRSQPSLQTVPSLSTSQPLDQTHHHCLATLKGHTAYISSLTLAGKFLYSGSSDREIRWWKRNPLDTDVNHENLTNNVVDVGKGAVKSLAVLADKMFSGHQDHKIRVWKISGREPDNQQMCTHLATLPTLGDRAWRILLPKNQVRIRRHKTRTWVHHVDTVSALALSKDESFLYSVSWDRTLKIWRTTDFKCLESIPNAHDDAINAVALSKDGDVYTGSADKKIKVWTKRTGEKKHSLVTTLEKHNSGINALALSSDGSVLYSGACDRSILVWEKDDDGANMVVVGALRGHTQSILCLVVMADLVCSGSADKSIRIWRSVDNRNYSCLAVLDGHNGPVKCLTATVDRANQSDTAYLVYSGGLDCQIKVWQINVPNP